MEGEGEVVVDGDSVHCHADDHLIFVPPGVPHYPRNPADADGTFRAMFVRSPALVNRDTYTADADGSRVDAET